MKYLYCLSTFYWNLKFYWNLNWNLKLYLKFYCSQAANSWISFEITQTHPVQLNMKYLYCLSTFYWNLKFYWNLNWNLKLYLKFYCSQAANSWISFEITQTHPVQLNMKYLYCLSTFYWNLKFYWNLNWNLKFHLKFYHNQAGNSCIWFETTQTHPVQLNMKYLYWLSAFYWNFKFYWNLNWNLKFYLKFYCSQARNSWIPFDYTQTPPVQLNMKYLNSKLRFHCSLQFYWSLWNLKFCCSHITLTKIMQSHPVQLNMKYLYWNVRLYWNLKF